MTIVVDRSIRGAPTFRAFWLFQYVLSHQKLHVSWLPVLSTPHAPIVMGRSPSGSSNPRPVSCRSTTSGLIFETKISGTKFRKPTSLTLTLSNAWLIYRGVSQRFGSIWICRENFAENRLTTSYSNKLKRGKKLTFGKNEQHQCIEYKILYRSEYTTTQ